MEFFGAKGEANLVGLEALESGQIFAEYAAADAPTFLLLDFDYPSEFQFRVIG